MPAKRILEQNLYELLEVSPSATTEEVERAWERVRGHFGRGSLAAYALLSPADAEKLADRVDEAYEVLLDPEARVSYDARLAPEEARPARGTPEVPAVAVTPPPPPSPAVEKPRPFTPPDGAVWTGELLQQAREARGLTLAQLSERTKLSRLQVEAVECDRFDQLPVPVYLRGIILCIARELRLDGQKVARSYLERVTAAGSRPVRPAST